ncbi:MAG: DUF2079 domain-containing protein [Bdellovibrionota bacterium]
MFPTRIGKIEVASIDPFALFFLLLLWASSRWFKQDFERFKKWALPMGEKVFKIKRPNRALVISISLVFGGLFIAHLFSYLNFHAHVFDMGFVNQAVFYPFSDGKLLQADLSPYRSYLVDHFAPTLLLLSPITSVFRSNIVVFALQAFLLGFGVYFLVAQGPLRKFRELFLLAALVLVSNRTLRAGALWDFREDIVGYVFLCLTILALIRGKILYYFIALLGYCLSKEHLGMVALGILAPILLDRSLQYSQAARRRLALATLVFLMLWNVAIFGWITPTLQKGIQDANNITMRYGAYGATPKEIIINVLISPRIWVELVKTKVLAWISIKYFILILIPYLYFARLAWPWLLAAFIGIAANLTSGSELQRSLHFHYDIPFMPFLMAATVIGIKKLAEAEKTQAVRNRKLLFGLLMAISFSGRWPMYSIIEHFPTYEKVSDTFFISSTECAQITAGDERVYPKLTHCPELRLFVLPDRCEEHPIQTLLEINFKDTSRIPGQNVQQARDMIFNKKKLCENSIFAALLKRGAQIVRNSKSGNYVEVALPEGIFKR